MNDYSHLEALIVENAKKRSAFDTQFPVWRKALITLRNVDPSWDAELRRIGNVSYMERFNGFMRGVERQLRFDNPRAKLLLAAVSAERVKARLK
jgi:hypothetical protein